MNKEIRKPTIHNMKRRSNAHNYSRRGFYHITISVSKAHHQPLGQIVGQLDKPDGDINAPHTELSVIGKMVEEELNTSIHHYYTMIEVQDYVIMPEHLHFILVAHSDVISRNNKPTHLGHVIAGFKYGCNKRFRAITGRQSLTPTTSSVLGDSVAKTAPPLFEEGYCDVMPIDEAQIATQRAYIHANPRSRLMRMRNRAWLQPQRQTVDTAVSLPALKKYLATESPDTMAEASFAVLEKRLLLKGRHISCDSYGNIHLLQKRILPVVCHRKDNALFPQQKARCLEEAAKGTILVSARISKREQDIMDTALLAGYPVVRIEDNGFSEHYHPSANRIDDCAANKLLILTPWSYQYRSHGESITVLQCKTMNCVAQAICKIKDNWWK